MYNSTLDSNISQQIEQCLQLLEKVLGDDLLGVYLYGSSIVGGLQRYSDLDIFVVSARPTSKDMKISLEKELLTISGLYRSTEKRPIELMVIVHSEVNPWHYPPKFDFQYGDWLRSKFENGEVEPWPTKVMPDLALLITQVLLGSKTIYGKEPNELLAEVPYSDFMTALTEELDSLRANLDSDTRNVLLTLARIWMTVETDSIGSKQKAAEWTTKKLPEEYKSVMHRAIVTAAGEQEETWEDLRNSITSCADFIVNQIRTKMKSLDVSSTSSKTISIVS